MNWRIGVLTSTFLIIYSITLAQLDANVVVIYKQEHSFKPPFFTTPLFWDLYGSTFVNNEAIILTPNEKSKMGMMWNTQALNSTDWEIEVEFYIRGSRSGADGIAVWYTAEVGQQGPIYGSRDKWTGMGVFIDTYESGSGKNGSTIKAFINDGTVNYDINNDGISTSLYGSCIHANVRNVPFALKISYIKKTFTVSYSNTPVKSHGIWHQCIQQQINLPMGYHIGISAETGGLSDEHSVILLSTYIYNDTKETPTQKTEYGNHNLDNQGPIKVEIPQKIDYGGRLDIEKRLDELEKLFDQQLATIRDLTSLIEGIDSKKLLESNIDKSINMKNPSDGIDIIGQDLSELSSRFSEYQAQVWSIASSINVELNRMEQEKNRLEFELDRILKSAPNNHGFLLWFFISLAQFLVLITVLIIRKWKKIRSSSYMRFK